MYPHLADRIYKGSPEHELPIEDGQIFRVEGATVRAVHRPGHSHDHVCFVLEEENAMFTGDIVLGHGTSTIEQLGYPAQGAVIPDLNGKIVTELAQKARWENQCLKGLGRIQKKGLTERLVSVTVSELINTIHGPRVDEEVQKMVLEPFMEEVLRKLAEDGKVAFRVTKGVKTWFALA
ncbi:metallo-beta-lactamase domain protein [Penicillium majusculum]|nr:metallo-beta-lactamase domain protein [Penicillium majusculum]